MQRLTAAGTARRSRWRDWTVPAIIVGIVAVVLIFKMPWRATDHEDESIAVLPFVDMSPQKDQDYFCDGITEELINRLSRVQRLRVPARTSAFTFKGKTEDVREIGSKLNVRTVLEGSVRKADNGLRITAQLINVADGYHLWSDTYDRELKDVFAIQDDISSAIVTALKLKLTPQEIEKISEHPIDNVTAYDCYLKAHRQIYRFDEESLDSAFMHLQHGIDIMGDNALLYSGMAYACWQYANMGIAQENYLNRAEEYAKKALALKPDLPSALTILGMLSIYEDYPTNLHDKFRYFKKALTSDPNDTRALGPLAVAYQKVGKPSEACALLERLERVDPLDDLQHYRRGSGYQYNCQFASALEEYRMFYRADSTSPWAQSGYSWTLVANGKHEEALAVIDRMAKTNDKNVMTAFPLLLKYALMKDKESALRVMTPDFRKTCWRDFEWSLLGASDEALDWLENAVSRGFINYPYLRCDPFFDNIRGEVRHKKLLERAKHEWEHFEVPE
jgi:TolB-like protein